MKNLLKKWLAIPCILIGILLFSGCGSTTGETTSDSTSDSSTQDTTREVTLSGAAQKGPLQSGSSIEIYELDADFEQTGICFQTEILSDFGNYNMPINLGSRYVELFAEGYYFDEVSGNASDGWLSLDAVADTYDSTTININILTTLAKYRVFELIDSGLSFEEANAQAKAEVLTAFGITAEIITSFKDMNIFEEGDDNVILLAISSIIMQMAHMTDDEYTSSALAQLIFDLSYDLEDNGQIDDAGLHALILQSILNVDPAEVKTNLEARFPEMNIPDFQDVITTLIYDYVYQSCDLYAMTSTCVSGCGTFFGYEVPMYSEFVMVVDASGNITGIFEDGRSADGTVHSDGTFEGFLRDMGFGVPMTGTISETGEVSGTWTFSFLGTTIAGTLSGHLITE